MSACTMSPRCGTAPTVLVCAVLLVVPGALAQSHMLNAAWSAAGNGFADSVASVNNWFELSVQVSVYSMAVGRYGVGIRCQAQWAHR